MLALLPLYYSLRSRTVPRTQLQNVKTSLVWETPKYVLFCHLFRSVFHQDRAQLWHFYWNHVTLVRSYQYLVGQFSEFVFIKITFRILSEMDSLDSLSNFFSFPKNMTSHPFWRQGMYPCEMQITFSVELSWVWHTSNRRLQPSQISRLRRGDQTLDLIITHMPHFYNKDLVQTFSPFGLSAHFVVLLEPN